jgi:hypothetical protein
MGGSSRHVAWKLLWDIKYEFVLDHISEAFPIISGKRGVPWWRKENLDLSSIANSQLTPIGGFFHPSSLLVRGYELEMGLSAPGLLHTLIYPREPKRLGPKQ